MTLLRDLCGLAGDCVALGRLLDHFVPSFLLWKWRPEQDLTQGVIGRIK